jgi:16S rRNA (uracil1498-N3)-methyltransferase
MAMVSGNSRRMPATPAWPPRSAPRLFVEPKLRIGATLHIDGNAAHYLAQVMRVSPGDAVLLCDDQTGEWAARVVAATRRSVTVDVVDHLRPRDDVPDLWLCVAPVKKPHFDTVLQKATELGVARIVPVLTQRSVVDRVNAERSQTIITEAAEQCARTARPEMAALTPLAALLRHWPDGRRLYFADEQGGLPALGAIADSTAPAAILIGPEGGWTDQERALITAHPATCGISLGPRILRAETAAITAVAIWMAACGDWG